VTAPLIALAAGGTGGHVFPAEALADQLIARHFRLALITDRRGQTYGGTLGRLDTHRVSAGGFAGRGPLSKIRAMGELAVGILQARRLLKDLRPAAVVGFGGYASLPAMVAAIHLGLPTLIHEQNAVLGRANRLLAGRVRRIATAFATVAHTGSVADRAIQVGMPVRAAVAALAGRPYVAPTADGTVRLLVLGGSQGARILSDVIPAALARLPEDLRRRLEVSQQCRPEDLDTVRRAYEGTGIRTELASFFDDVPERMAGAHLAIARSGASTVAELLVLGRPAILVPYPHAIDDHQRANAAAISATGAAWTVLQREFNAADLAGQVAALIESPAVLTDAANRAKAAGRPDAAARLADLVANLPTDRKEPRP
jgi:UDP-N-acetylglucosamine--N-acetylmuramyl-(pentapeptide) pyrophosphoryl-undecaprenol N-acetylglucosamine transferase